MEFLTIRKGDHYNLPMAYMVKENHRSTVRGIGKVEAIYPNHNMVLTDNGHFKECYPIYGPDGILEARRKQVHHG